MITARAWAGRHYAVLGLARSGLATVEALLASGAQVTAWDDREEARAKILPGRGEDLVLSDLNQADLSQFDSIVVTPGLPLNRHPIAARAMAAGVEIIGDIELFARARPELPPHKVVGITGTNGKSTTTALIHHIFQTAGVPSLMGGNIGLPILSQDPLPEGGVYILELSSFQIDLTRTLDCDVAVLLNVTPDHLDRYDSFEAYAASKARLFAMQSPHRLAVVDQAAETNQQVLEDAEDPQIHFIQDIEPGDPSGWPALQGPHNRDNAAAAVATCLELGLSDPAITNGLRTYPGLPHRMERVTDRNGVLFVNDSKATNPEAAAPALAAFPRVRWIVGGQAKSNDLGDTAKHLGHVVQAYTIGESGPMFAALLRAKGITVTQAETLENAVNRASEDSQPGDTVLLSPACASFDQFRDFEARGDAFRQWVGEL